MAVDTNKVQALVAEALVIIVKFKLNCGSLLVFIFE